MCAFCPLDRGGGWGPLPFCLHSLGHMWRQRSHNATNLSSPRRGGFNLILFETWANFFAATRTNSLDMCCQATALGGQLVCMDNISYLLMLLLPRSTEHSQPALSAIQSRFPLFWCAAAANIWEMPSLFTKVPLVSLLLSLSWPCATMQSRQEPMLLG